MRRLIDDKRRKRNIWILVITTLVVALSWIGYNKFSSINEQWRLDAQVVLQALQDKHNWLVVKMNPSHDAADLETKIAQIVQSLVAQESVTKAKIDSFQKTRMDEEEAKKLASKCHDLCAEINSTRARLDALSKEGESMKLRLNESANSQTIKESKDVCSKVDRTYSSLNQTCVRQIVISRDYQDVMDKSREIVGVVENKQNNHEWKLIEEMHEKYTKWCKDVTEQLSRLDELDHSLQENFQKLQTLPLDRENLRENIQKQIEIESKAVAPLIAKGTDLCNNSNNGWVMDLGKSQSTAKTHFDSITKLREQHGEYVMINHVTSATIMLESIEKICRDAPKQVAEQRRIILEILSTIRILQGNMTAELYTLQNNGNGISDEQIMDKCEKCLVHIQKLQESRSKLKNEINVLTDFLDKQKSDAAKNANAIVKLSETIQQSFLDWEAEGRKITGELNGLRQRITRIQGDLGQIQTVFQKYRYNGNPRDMTSLREKLGNIQTILAETEDISDKPVKNGIELMKLIKQRDHVKLNAENAEQKTKALHDELDRALQAGRLINVKNIDLNTLVKELDTQEGNIKKCHFYLSVDIPTNGNHKVEIKLMKDINSLCKLAWTRKHYIVIQYAISGAQGKSGSFRWKDETRNPWNEKNEKMEGWEPIRLEGYYSAGMNDFILDFEFHAETEKGGMIDNGKWQFLNNFTIEILVDGIKPRIVEMQVKDE